MPILNIINKNNLINVSIVVIRYFGGIKLGAGGLCRAYSNSARDIVLNSILSKVNNSYIIEVIISYDEILKLENLIKITNSVILEKNFLENSIFIINVKDIYLNKFDIFKYNIKKESIIIN